MKERQISVPAQTPPVWCGMNQESPIVCLMCEGTHGSNTLCQMPAWAPWEDCHEIV